MLLAHDKTRLKIILFKSTFKASAAAGEALMNVHGKKQTHLSTNWMYCTASANPLTERNKTNQLYADFDVSK